MPKYFRKSLTSSFLKTFYTLILHAQIQKAQKDSDDLTVFLRFWILGT